MSKKNEDNEDNIEYVGSYFLEEDANGILVSLEPGVINEILYIKELSDVGYFKDDASLNDVLKSLLFTFKEYRDLIIQLNDLLLAVDTLAHIKVRDMIKSDLITENYIKYVKSKDNEDYKITGGLCNLEQIGLGYF